MSHTQRSIEILYAWCLLNSNQSMWMSWVYCFRYEYEGNWHFFVRTRTHTHVHLLQFYCFRAFHFVSFHFVAFAVVSFFNARKIQFQKWVKWVNNVIITILFIRDNMLQLLCVQVQHCMPYKLKWICIVCTQHMLRWTFSCVYLICMFAGVEFSFTLDENEVINFSIIWLKCGTVINVSAHVDGKSFKPSRIQIDFDEENM